MTENPVDSKSENADEPLSVPQIANLFATIHWRSPQRPNGYTTNEVELMNIEANRHIPELYEKLKQEREQRLSRERSSPSSDND